MTKLSISEAFALDQWLSEYPEDLTYEQVLECLEDDQYTWSHPDITPWVVVENFPLADIADFIRDTRTHFAHAAKLYAKDPA